MYISQVILLILLCLFCVYKGETYTVGSPIPAVLVSNDINPNETVSSRQGGYGLIRFDGPVDHEGDQHGQQLVTFTDDRQNNRPLKFEDDFGPSDKPIRNIPIPSSTDQYDTNFNINGQNFNQNSGQRRKRRRRRKSRRFLDGVRDVRLGPGHGQPLPNLTEMSGPLRVVSDALASILENDTKRCVRRMLCEQAATNDQIHNSTLMQTVLSVFQYIPYLQRGAAINALPLANSVGVLSVAMRYGAAARNVSACEHRYPDCPNDPEERIHYMNNHNGGLFRFFKGNDQHQYTANEFHNRLLKLGLKPQKQHAANAYGLYQPEYGTNGERLAYPYPFTYGLQKPYPNAGGQYGLRHNNFQPNPPNSNGPYHNQPPLGTSNSFTGQVNPNQQGHSVYSPAYPHYRRFYYDEVGFKGSTKDNEGNDNEIQRRIQNKPEVFTIDNNANSKWSFPKLESSDLNNIRGGRQLKFPDKENGQWTDKETVKQAKGFLFPGAQSNRKYFDFLSDISADDDIKFDNAGSENAAKDFPNSMDGEGFEVVYIVRGNGDPRHPEMVKLRPGEKIL